MEHQGKIFSRWPAGATLREQVRNIYLYMIQVEDATELIE